MSSGFRPVSHSGRPRALSQSAETRETSVVLSTIQSGPPQPRNWAGPTARNLSDSPLIAFNESEADPWQLYQR